MLRFLRTRLTYSNVVATTALFVALGGVASASGWVFPDGNLHACVSNTTGQVYLLQPPATTCPSGRSAVKWNRAGPRPPVFVHLSLLNGWQAGPFDTGTPEVGISNGIVYFRGALDENAKTFDETAFVLPAAYRPSVTRYVPVDMVDATTGRLDIQPDGSVYIQDTASGNDAKLFTSLEGASFVR